MNDDGPILDYAGPGVAPKRPRVLLVLMAAVTLVICFIYWFAAMDTRSFVQQWKRYGNNPSVLPQLEAAAQQNTRLASLVFAVATVGWSSYFAVRWFRRSRSR